MRSIGDFLFLPAWRLRVFLYELLQQRKVRRSFYQDAAFEKLDQEVLSLPNPFRIPEAFPYGETPLFTLKALADRFGLGPQDRLLELGCGRGRAAFFLSWYTGCKAHGIDTVASFIENAAALAKRHGLCRMSFSQGDLRGCDVEGATFVYLYGTCLDEASIRAVEERLKLLPKGAKIATVSYPLESFELADRCTLSFPWGKGEVFFQIR